jgi:hypothetical protein
MRSLRSKLRPIAFGLLVLSLTACGASRTEGSLANADADAALPPLAANAHASANNVKIPITHLGAYEWKSPPIARIHSSDVFANSVGVKVSGGEVEFARGKSGEVSISGTDTPEGLVHVVTFEVVRYTGAPTVTLTRATTDTKQASSDS